MPIDYVFVFVGEFGVELLNWQGVVRKFRDSLPAGDRIVVGSRASLSPLYEFADVYVDIADVSLFRNSRAMAYFALPGATSSWDSLAARRFNERLKADITAHITDELLARAFWEHTPGGQLPPHQFVFSSDHTELDGIAFGRTRHGSAGAIVVTLYEQMKHRLPGHLAAIEQWKRRVLASVRSLDRNTEANIYELLDVSSNRYVRVSPDWGALPRVVDGLGWDPSEPFILCQTRQRGTMQRSPDLLSRVAVKRLLAIVSSGVRLVLLSFQTGRWLDSYSTFDELPNCTAYHCRSFSEQALLVFMAKHCLFFTEGDFGSHIYVPPFLGRDVTAIAPASVYGLGTTPIDFWNRHVFTFGGQIRALAAEDVLASETSIQNLAASILSTASTAPMTKEVRSPFLSETLA